MARHFIDRIALSGDIVCENSSTPERMIAKASKSFLFAIAQDLGLMETILANASDSSKKKCDQTENAYVNG
jgi:hypothetical protein